MSGYSVEAILKATGAESFARSFKNAASGVQDLEKKTNSFGGNYSKSMRKAVEASGGFIDAQGRIRDANGRFMSDAEKARLGFKNIGDSASGSGSKIKSFTASMAGIATAIGVTKLIAAGFNAIRSSVDGAVSRVDTLNQFPKVLQQMGASGEDADRSIARLSDGIQGLPTTLDGVASTAQRMFTILGDIDLATESTLALNNAFLASGASQADASRGLEQYTQMLSAGKVDMQSWRTLQETMPYALKETAEAFGFTGQSATNDFYAALQSGEVTMDEMNAKIIELSTETGGFAETSLEASKGLATSWQNIKTAIVTGTANIIQAINEWMEDAGLGGIAENFDKVKVAVQGAFGYIVENIPIVLNKIRDLFDTVKNSTAFQTMRDVIQLVIDKGQELISAFLESEAWANFKSLMADVAQAILDIDFSQVLQDVGEFIDKWSPLIAGILGAVGAFKVINGVIDRFKNTVGMVKTAVELGGAAIGFLTSPIGLAVAAIGIIIAIGVLLYKNWDTIKERAQELGAKISEIWDNIKTWTSETWEGIKTAITDAVMGAWNAITEWFGQLPTWFSETWNSIVESVTEWATNMIEKAIEVGTQFVENISTFFSELPYNVGFFLGEVIGTVIQWGIDMWEKAKETGSNFIEAISTFFSELPGRVSGFLTTTWTNVTTWATNMWTKAKETGANFINGIVEWFSQLPGRISAWITNAYNNVVTWASNMATKAKQAGSDFINGVITFVQTLPGKIQTWLIDTISRLTTWASNMGSKGREAGTDLLNKTVDAVKELPGKMASAGGDMVRGFWEGITNLGGWIKDKVGNFFGGIVDGVKSKLKIFSPSRVFRDEIGKMIVKGFGQGIERNEKEAINPMERMLDNVIGVFDSQTSGLGATFSVTGEGNIASAMNRALDVDMPMMNGHVSHSVRGGNVGGSINVTQYITSPNALNEREMQRRSRLELQKLGVDFAY